MFQVHSTTYLEMPWLSGMSSIEKDVAHRLLLLLGMGIVLSYLEV